MEPIYLKAPKEPFSFLKERFPRCSKGTKEPFWKGKERFHQKTCFKTFYCILKHRNLHLLLKAYQNRTVQRKLKT
jgi:hypothetical protein